MCGICGIKSLNSNSVDLKKSQFLEMLNSLNHRGPDFNGHYIKENLYL
jgi:asparagine synthetase B (glutamine-hydrolysing)